VARQRWIANEMNTMRRERAEREELRFRVHPDARLREALHRRVHPEERR
jgi:hypothetical protein